MRTRLRTSAWNCLLLLPIPLLEGATGASTWENTDSLASSMSCCENLPDLAQSTASAKAWSVSVERGSLGDPKGQLFTRLPMEK